jgi:methionine-R-sulfoxide reductase
MDTLSKIQASLLGIAALGLAAFTAVANGMMSQVPPMKPKDEAGGKAGTFAGSPKRKDKVVLSDAEWRKRLTPEQYKILRGHGTEAAFCGRFHDHKKDGVYHCAGCNLPLFKSDSKFDSGTGWPSFFQPYAKDSIWTRRDTSYGMVRDEVLCARCDGHLGHVFDDGPVEKGGLRFCMNSDAMTFKAKK